jgi:septum formation protein
MAPGKETNWILASASPRRSEILRQLGLRFKIDPCRDPEPLKNTAESPSAYVRRVSRLKAAAVAKRHPDSRIIAADTIVLVNNTILGKPSGRAEAREMLRRLSGRRHEVLTGLCLITSDDEPRRVYSSATCSDVHFRRMPDAEIDWYLNTGEYRDKAGAYGIQGFASLFIGRIEGCYFNIVGFPVSEFARLCRRAKINLFQDFRASAV